MNLLIFCYRNGSQILNSRCQLRIDDWGKQNVKKSLGGGMALYVLEERNVMQRILSEIQDLS